MDADLIIAGAGAAGLALACRAAELAPEARIVVVDRKLQPARRQLWSFWAADEPARELSPVLAGLVQQSWSAAELRFAGLARRQSIAPLRYHTVRSEDYRARLLARLRGAAQVTLVEADVLDIDEDERGARVCSSAGMFAAPYAFQSLRPCPRDYASSAEFPLRQVFCGWTVRSPTARFDPSAFTWMNFDVEQELGLSFVYELPFSPTEQFVEFTVLTPASIRRSALEQALRAYLRRRYPGELELRPREFGSIAMTERQLGQLWSGPEGPRRVFNVGAAGGMTKASTGYAFARSLRQTEQLLRGWLAGEPKPLPPASRRFRLYDATMLRMLCERPAAGLEFFRGLLGRGDLRRVLRFLDERSSILDEALLFTRLPFVECVRSAGPALAAIRSPRSPPALRSGSEVA